MFFELVVNRKVQTTDEFAPLMHQSSGPHTQLELYRALAKRHQAHGRGWVWQNIGVALGNLVDM